MDLGEPTTAILLNKHNPSYILNIYPILTGKYTSHSSSKKLFFAIGGNHYKKKPTTNQNVENKTSDAHSQLTQLQHNSIVTISYFICSISLKNTKLSFQCLHLNVS